MRVLEALMLLFVAAAGVAAGGDRVQYTSMEAGPVKATNSKAPEALNQMAPNSTIITAAAAAGGSNKKPNSTPRIKPGKPTPGTKDPSATNPIGRRPTYTPFVPEQAAVVCRDGAAAAAKLTPQSCAERYNRTRAGCIRVNAAAGALNATVAELRETVAEKTALITSLKSAVQQTDDAAAELQKQVDKRDAWLASNATAHAKAVADLEEQWAGWVEGNVTAAQAMVSLARQQAVGDAQRDVEKCLADLAEAEEAAATCAGAWNTTLAANEELEEAAAGWAAEVRVLQKIAEEDLPECLEALATATAMA